MSRRQTPPQKTSRPYTAVGPTRKEREEAKRQRELEREEAKRQRELERERIQQEQIEEKNRKRKALIEECIQKGNEAAGALNRIEEIERIDKYIYEARSAEKAFRNNNLARIEFQKRNYHNSLKLFKSVIIFANKVIEANSFRYPVPVLTPAQAACAQESPASPAQRTQSPRARASQDKEIWHSPSTENNPNKSRNLSSALGQPSVW